MTGAYAHDWSGRGAWADSEGRGCGPRHGRHGRSTDGERGGSDRGRDRDRGRRGGPGGAGFPLQELAGWALARGKRHGPLGPEELEHLEQMIALRRMRGGGGSPFRGSGRGGPRGRGRRRRGDVRLAVLRLLAEEPRNGYQLMQALEERSGGTWRPSPGSMYPTLSQLEDEGLVAATVSGSERRFELTDAGRAALEERAGEPDPWTPDPNADESAMSELGPLVFGIGKAVWQVAADGDDAQRAKAAELLGETRRRLYGILAEAPEETTDASPADGDDAPTDD